MHFRFGVILLLILLVAGIAVTCLFRHIHAPLSQALQEASDYALTEDWENANSLAQSAREQWERWRNFTAAVADHAPLEEMEALFSQLEIYRALQLHGEFAAVCAQLAQMAAAMEESQVLAWWTML